MRPELDRILSFRCYFTLLSKTLSQEIMTPDGISTDDWDRVHEVVVEVVNASAIEDNVLCDHYKERLFGILDELESIYGRIPGVLATRADFTDEPTVAIALHEEALAVAIDPISSRLSLQSLIRLKIDGRHDETSTATLLLELERLTDTDRSSSDLDELRELQTDFERTKRRKNVSILTPDPRV